MTPAAAPARLRRADITYGTNNEFGFDYLRDNMAMRLEDCVQRGYQYAIVDEVDSILIDEARTPLIISGMVADSAKWYQTFARIAPRLKRDEDYEVEESKYQVAVTEAGVAKVEEMLGIENLYEHVNTPLVHHLQNALRAKELYKRDVAYVVVDGEVKIVDEFTGRVLEGRRYSEGLHQAIEAKEGVQDQGREPDARHDHDPELLQDVREVVGHDRYGQDPADRVRGDVQDRRHRDPDEPRHDPRRRSGPDLQERGSQVERARWRTSSSATRTGSRSWSAPSRSRSRSCSPASSTGAVSSTTC